MIVPYSNISLSHFSQSLPSQNWESVFEVLEAIKRAARCIQQFFQLNTSKEESTQFLYLRVTKSEKITSKKLKRSIKEQAVQHKLIGYVRKIDTETLEIVVLGLMSNIIHILSYLKDDGFLPLEISNKIGKICMQDSFYIKRFLREKLDTILFEDSSDDGETAVSESSIISTDSDSMVSYLFDHNLNIVHEMKYRITRNNEYMSHLIDKLTEEFKINTALLCIGVIKNSKWVIEQYHFLPILTRICLNLSRFNMKEECDSLFIRICAVYTTEKKKQEERNDFKKNFNSQVMMLTREWLEVHVNIYESILTINSSILNTRSDQLFEELNMMAKFIKPKKKPSCVVN